MDKRFTNINQLIKQSQTNAIKALNAELINVYLKIGEYLSRKIDQSEWGGSVMTELAVLRDLQILPKTLNTVEKI
jgi:hypothetical protein